MVNLMFLVTGFAQDDFEIIDVRTDQEFRQGHLVVKKNKILKV
jgi:hypothetical protein